MYNADGLGEGSTSLGVKTTEVATERKESVTADCSTAGRDPGEFVAKLAATEAAEVASHKGMGLRWFWLLLEKVGYEH